MSLLISVGSIDINNGNGTLTVLGSTRTGAGTISLSISINGVQSAPFTLNIGSVTLESNGCVLKSCPAICTVTTVNVPTSLPGTVTWYNTSGTNLGTTPPTGIAVTQVNTGSATRTFTVSASSGTPPLLQYHITVTIDGIESNKQLINYDIF
jgi:hypothetical protein